MEKLWSGIGLFGYGDNDFYYGGVKENSPDGQGLRSYPNGKKFNGTFSLGTPINGNGYMHYSDGSSYEGVIINGKTSGYGVVIYADASVYKGSFTDGKRNGKGDFFDKNGNLDYTGEWEDGKMHRPDQSVRVKKESEQIFNRVTFKGYKQETMNGQNVAVDINAEYHFTDYFLQGTHEEVLTIGDTKYRRKINFTGT